MAIHHSQPGEVLNLKTLNNDVPHNATFALVKTETMEVIRMHLAKGKKIPVHSVTGEITVQCISGRVAFSVESEPHVLNPADWLYLSANQEHSLDAFEDSVLLVTIFLK